MAHLTNSQNKIFKRIASVIFTLCFLTAFSSKAVCISNNVYYKYCDGSMNIALTFDDGPHPKKTPKILDLLSEFGIHATFFMIGQNIEYYPSVAKRIISEGHEIGNHTYSHPRLTKAQKGCLTEEMISCERSMQEILGCGSSIFRPPEGIVDADVRRVALDMGYNVILWSVDTRDWAGTSTEDIVSNVIANVHPGDIILMHDYTGNKCHTIDALRLLLPKLSEKGYNFVTVSELISG